MNRWLAALPAPAKASSEYLIDVAQRNILFWDLLRQRSEQYYAYKAQDLPHVLTFEAELVLDARTFDRPVNYLLARILPPAGVVIDPQKRPFIVVDPRAGHGPGIGGFKADSELGVAMQAGHPCYFVGFTPDPMPGQTIEDVMHAEAVFIEEVIARHPQADGKPCIIGNCQAGWAVMMLAATRPELCGPLIIPGSPISYWAGIEGKSPMRYSGGLLGGSWLTALSSDLGNGKFDGGHLVRNFENLNPANTLWGKQYDIWANVDNGGGRYLEFEKWWGGHVNMNAEEIQWIVDNLFVGNRLATAELLTQAGERIDLRKICSPIVCFCSHGDDITPPPQALGWIVDLYATDDDIRACGQTIVYALHDNAGHLGIFVSGNVARKEHQEFASNIDLIDVLPPGLYEAVMTPRTSDDANPHLIDGDWIVRFEPRRLDDIRDIVQPSLDNERRFATVRRLSEINLGLYRSFLQPLVKAIASEPAADWQRKLNPSELPYELFSEKNPLMRPLAQMAEGVRAQRIPAAPDNPFLEWQAAVSEVMLTGLNGWRDMRNTLVEQTFLMTFGSPLLQAMTGLLASDESPRRRPGNEPERTAYIEERIQDLLARIADGGPREAVIRSLGYIGMGSTGVDERTFNQLVQMRARYGEMSLADFKELVREQYFSLLLNEEAALAAIPAMLPTDSAVRDELLADIRRTVSAAGSLGTEELRRLETIEALFMGTEKPAPRVKKSRPAKVKERAEKSVIPA
ncbi:MAG: 3-hydroxyalkanoate synthetase [Betaproteobacteria bacterium HGW-Betaproteobacteria-7]|nr:MAG: 3-hydroxyalkanoate synthetase [Betaproteobacteria bacterium HGW-Betaproteobacteria-7]